MGKYIKYNKSLKYLISSFFFPLIVLFNILQGGLSIVPLCIVDHIPTNYLITSFINISYILLSGSKIKIITINKYSLPILFFFLIICFQLLHVDNFQFSTAVFLNQFTFLLLLFSAKGKNVLSQSEKPYIIYSFYNVIIVFFVFFFIRFFGMDPLQNQSTLSLFVVDGDIAYFPYYLSIFRVDDTIRLSYFFSNGLICGLSHEPHVIGYLCMPAFYMLWYKNKKRTINQLIIIIFYLLFILITFSVTTVLSFTAVLFAILFLSLFNKKKIYSLILITVFVSIFIILVKNFDLSFIQQKLSDDGGSKMYSIERLLYAFMPTSILGTTIYTTDINGDIGIISCILNICFYSSLIVSIYKLLIKNSSFKYIGVSALYFLFHSLKIFLLIYRYPFTLFFLFLLYKGLSSEKTYFSKSINIDVT